MKLAATVSERVEIDCIQLVETVAKRKTFREKLPEKVETGVGVHAQLDDKASRIAVRARFTLTARYQETATGDDEVLRIEAVFLLVYRVDSTVGLKRANIDAFGELNAVFNAWPYWREYVQATTVRMGLPALTVPALKLFGRKPSRRPKPVRGAPKRDHVKRRSRPVPTAKKARIC